jgi:hypothetical protein
MRDIRTRRTTGLRRPPVIGRIADDAFLLDVRAVDDASAFAVSFSDTRS